MNDTKVSFIKGFKYRLYPNKEQKEYLAKVFGSCRWVYNHFLDKNKKEYELHKEDPAKYPKPDINEFSFSIQLTLLKKVEETAWLIEAPSQVLQQPTKHLVYALTRFFKTKKGYPKFKNKCDKQSATYPNQAYRFIQDKFYLAKMKSPFKVVWNRELPKGKITGCTISKTSSGEYYASFVCEHIAEKTNGTGVIGIDAGITDLHTISNGTIIANPRHYVNAQKKLCRLQRLLSRKKKGSSNRNKARIKVAKHHALIANQRSDYLHKLSTKLIRENQAIAIETLNVSGMIKNRKLSKHIADAGWGMFREMLKYKAVASQHCYLFLADPYFPSTQLCSTCGKKPKEKLKLVVRKWTCTHCGSIHQRDMNAAKNLEILATTELYRLTSNNIEGQIILTDRYIPYVE